MTMSMWHGAPYVRSKSDAIDAMLKELNLAKGTKFLELGCGDGRVICQAVKQYGAKGRGVDISWLWLILANIRAWRMGIRKEVQFVHQNIIDVDVTWADVIYIYMMPRFLAKHGQRIFNKAKPGTIVVSNTFDIPYLKDKYVKVLKPNSKSELLFYRL